MAVTVERSHPTSLHPVHAVLLAGTVPLFLSATLADIAYAQTFQIQWTNFASWLIVGAMVFTGLALLCALIGLRHEARRRGRYGLYVLLLLATFILGFINSLVHAKDAWAAMPGGLVLSVVCTLLALAATWLGFAGYRHRMGDLP